ncbi:MAG TPA: outer membrane beta-barrel family protein [Bacteroidia bacterium]|nr:outer membrane beta-barrel family protein [Bacteroidia bacterium]
MTKQTLLYSIFFLATALSSFSQRPQGGGGMPGMNNGGNPSGPGGMRLPVGRVYGKVIDASSKEPMEYAVVTLLAFQKDSVIGGGLSKANGDFSIDKLPMGRFRLRIQSIGYKTLFVPVVITPATIEQDLGNIRLEVDAKVLKEVKVEADKSNVTMNIDRKVYNADKDLSAKGGTAIDVMKNVPGVTVDADGNVALRNSSPTIFVNGRPTTLTLEQIPAEDIDRIEVITNPSAKFDASATGGILNVILKQNTKPGYNGMLGASIGTNNRYGLNGNINVKESPFNFFLSYNLNMRGNSNKGFTNRENLMNEEVISSFRQTNNNMVRNAFNSGRIGFDYNISNRNTITFSQNITSGSFNMDDEQSFSTADSIDLMTSFGNRVNDQKNGFENYTTQILFRHTFPKKGKEFTTDLSYNKSNNFNNSTFTTYNYNAGGVLLPDNPIVQKNIGAGGSDMFTFQFDFTNPLTDSSKFEWGIKSNYKIQQSELTSNMLDYTTGYFTRDSSLSNDYRINDLINAAYATYSSYVGSIAYQAGVRLEQTQFTAELLDKNQTFEYAYPKGGKNLWNALFPSLYLSKRFDKGREAQLNFSRKINRPNYMQMMPFIMFSDRQNYRIGNPALAPEFMNMAEVNYNHPFKKGNLLSSVYLKYVDNAITNYAYTLPTDSNVLVTTFTNGNSNWSYGTEHTLKLSLTKKMEFTLNANAFYTVISANTGTQALQNEGISWNVKAIVSYKLPKGFNMQVDGQYEAPRIIPQGTTKEVYAIDFSLNKEINKKFTFNFTVNDVFNTRRWGTYFDTPTFTQDLSRRRDVRFVRIGFTWRFGETDVSLFRKKNNQRREPGAGGMEMDY